jgi:hypothetical protein
VEILDIKQIRLTELFESSFTLFLDGMRPV